MKNYILTFALAVLVVLAGVTLRRSIGAIGTAPVPPIPSAAAIGTAPVPPIPSASAIGTAPVPPIPSATSR